MRNFYKRGRIAILLALLCPLGLVAQESSINTYSPYSFYGVGNLFSTSGAALNSMGGASIGFRSYMKINVNNPAAYSSVAQKSFLFDVSLRWNNVYSKQNNGSGGFYKTADNSLNLGDISILFPLAKKLGFGLTISPYSTVGYRTQRYETSDDIIADLGSVKYTYSGEGGITQLKMGVGWEPFPRVSIGAELIYLRGNIDRYYDAKITAITGAGNFNSLSASTNEKVSRVFANFGAQVNAITTDKTRLTIGATYRLGGKLRADVTDYIPSNNVYGDTVRFDKPTSNITLPSTIGVGIFLHRPVYSIGFDYIYQDWAAHNSYDARNQVGFRNTHTFKLGAQFTPSRYDVRNFLKRFTYRIGLRYSDYYMTFRGEKLAEKAVTFGVEIPFGMTAVSNLNIGLEVGNMGTLRNGLVRERFVRLNLGVTLFGGDHDYWFVKYKYD